MKLIRKQGSEIIKTNTFVEHPNIVCGLIKTSVIRNGFNEIKLINLTSNFFHNEEAFNQNISLQTDFESGVEPFEYKIDETTTPSIEQFLQVVEVTNNGINILDEEAFSQLVLSQEDPTNKEYSFSNNWNFFI